METKLTVCLPQHIDERGAGDEYALDTHALEVVKLGEQTTEIATKAQLSLPPIPLIDGPEVIVVGRVAIGELVEQDGIEGYFAPVWGARGSSCLA